MRKKDGKEEMVKHTITVDISGSFTKKYSNAVLKAPMANPEKIKLEATMSTIKKPNPIKTAYSKLDKIIILKLLLQLHL